MADNRQINDKYAKIGAELIANEDALTEIRESQVTIVFLSSDHAKMDKGRAVLGQCEKVQDKYKWGIPADFTITLFEPNIENKSQEAIRRIILHELLHVGIGEKEYFVKPHDLEDFKLLIDRWGTDWANVDDVPEAEFEIDDFTHVDEHIICPNCRGSRLSWKSDFSFREYGMEGNGMVHLYECLDCRASIMCMVEEGDE